MAEGMEGGERAGSMPAGQLDYLSSIPSPTPSELTDAVNMLNDLIYVSSVLLLVAVIAKVLVANVILRQRAEVERLFKMRQQVCSDAKLVRAHPIPTLPQWRGRTLNTWYANSWKRSSGREMPRSGSRRRVVIGASMQ